MSKASQATFNLPVRGVVFKKRNNRKFQRVRVLPSVQRYDRDMAMLYVSSKWCLQIAEARPWSEM